MKRVYLGCGDSWKSGFVNVDARRPRNFVGSDDTMFIQADVTQLTEIFEVESVDLIRAEMLVEHIPQVQLPEFFYQCWTVLKPSGRLELLTPDFEAIVSSFVEMRQKGYNRTEFEKMAHILLNSFAGMTVYDCHKSLIYRDYLQDILESEGFTNIRFQNIGTRGWGLLTVAERGSHVDRETLREVTYNF